MQRIINDLENLSFYDYKVCLETVVYKLKAFDFIKSIYIFGDINYPSISDIDMLIVVDCNDNYDEKKKFIKKTIADTPNGKYCFWHEPIIISESDVKFIPIFHTINNIQLIHGYDYKSRFIRTKREYRKLLQKQLDIYYFMITLELKQVYNVSKRLLLLLLNNIAFSLKANNSPNYINYQLKVNQLRQKVMEDINTRVDKELQCLLKLGIEYYNNLHKKECNCLFLKYIRLGKTHFLIFFYNKILRLKIKRFIFNIFPASFYIYMEKYKSFILTEKYIPKDTYQRLKNNIFEDTHRYLNF